MAFVPRNTNTFPEYHHIKGNNSHPDTRRNFTPTLAMLIPCSNEFKQCDSDKFEGAYRNATFLD